MTKISINQLVELSLDQTHMAKAEKWIGEIEAGSLEDEFIPVIDCLTTLLMFRAIERAAPGVLDRILAAAKR